MPSNNKQEHINYKTNPIMDHHFYVKSQFDFAQCVKKLPQPHVTSDWRVWRTVEGGSFMVQLRINRNLFFLS